MVLGEPGVGKTRTIQELSSHAETLGVQVLWGRCYEEEGTPPYWPWVQPISSYIQQADPERLCSEAGSGAADIAEVIPNILEKLPDLEPPPALEPEQARFRLFNSVTAFLKNITESQPLMLVLDDLHWADKPSLMLLQFIAKELGNSRLLLVGTYRDVALSRQHPLADTLGELTRERLFQRVLLRGLSRQDVERFIEVTTGVTPPTGLTEVVHTRTEGNPLFVTELVRLLVQEGDLTPEYTSQRDAWMVRIPEGVREVIGRRLNRLSQRCNETLTTASVIGREFEFRHLGPLVEDMSEDRLLEVLEEALSSRVIEEMPQSVGRYQFTHALIQETLSEELTLTRRVRLHARIAETLEGLYGDNAETHASVLAHHFAEAQTILGAGKLVYYSTLAGERALSARAYEEALAHFQRGMTAKGVQSGPTEPPPGSVQGIDADTAAILYGLGRAQASLLSPSEWPEPLSNLTRAFDFYFESGDVDRAVAIAENPLFAGFGSGASQVGTRALSLVQPDSHAAGRLLSHYGITIYHDTANYEGARDAFARAGAIARREGDTALEAEALGNGAHVDADECHWEEALEIASKAGILIFA
jgi:predicted ATPase